MSEQNLTPPGWALVPVAQPEQAEDETTECEHCCGKGWNYKWEAVAGHFEGGEYFEVECEHCDGSGERR